MQRKNAIGVAAMAAALAAPAAGQDRERSIRVTIGGYMEQAFGAATNRAGVRTFDATLKRPNRWAQMSDSEIWFSGRTTLVGGLADGMVVGFNVQLEANTQNDQIDESYLFVDGAFGRLILGSENDAAYVQHVGPPRPGGGWGVLETAATRWVAEPRFTAFLTTTAPLVTGDDQKLVYYTPRVAGLQLGGAFTPAAKEDDNEIADRTTVRTNAVTLSANYTATLDAPWFGIPPIGLRASAGGVRVPPVENARFADQRHAIVDVGVGAQLALAGFALGGGYRRVENPDGLLDGRVWAAGLAWTRGRLSVGVSMLDSRVAGSATVPGTDRGRIAMVSGAWTLGPRIDLTAAVFQVEFRGEDPKFTIQDDNQGTGAVAGLKLSF